ncbi:MAG: glycoside hydrolase [Deltaproteobacteria bacterium]|nr:glycoside hydrolase [Deltaproteobacteria bacterium]
MADRLELLPRPRELRLEAGALRFYAMPAIRVRAERPDQAERARERVRTCLGRDAGLRALEPGADAPTIELQIDPALRTPAEGFELSIGSLGVLIRARDPRGLNWGAGLLAQIVRQSDRQLPCLRARDWPDFASRGYMLDVSRDRVPTMATLFDVIDLLEELRLNELQLYTEHTFAYSAHERVWRDASPLTALEIRALDAACAERGIELVPNQNSFGHMERWLRHPEYRALAELESGAQGASCLAPGAQSVAFMRSLYAELLPNFGSRSINIGCDETLELGKGRSRDACASRGQGRVYLDFLLELMRGLHDDGRTVQFWGDIVVQHPELIGELPRERTVALAWGYEAPRDPAAVGAQVRELFTRVGIDLEGVRGFDTLAGPYATAGVPYRVCPGTSSWLSLIGRLPNALSNLRDAVQMGRANGAEGVLITDWGDRGHLQPPVVSLPALAWGAAASWCLASQSDLDLARALDLLLLRDRERAIGAALVRLGELGSETGLDTLNTSPLATALATPLGRAPALAWGETSRARLDAIADELRAHVERLSRARPAGFGGEICARELRQAAALARHGAHRLMHATPEGGPAKSELRAELEPLIEEQAACWRERSREGGLCDSLARLRSTLADYV